MRRKSPQAIEWLWPRRAARTGGSSCDAATEGMRLHGIALLRHDLVKGGELRARVAIPHHGAHRLAAHHHGVFERRQLTIAFSQSSCGISPSREMC
jgi:hypothetical protein